MICGCSGRQGEYLCRQMLYYACAFTSRLSLHLLSDPIGKRSEAGQVCLGDEKDFWGKKWTKRLCFRMQLAER
jgi:hypothetical protein